jgi:uncharacterized membrane protein YgcG
METPILDTPVPGSLPRWQLSAPESYVLLHGPGAKGVEAFKKGLLELVARAVLTIETRQRRRFFVLTTQTSFLLTGPKASSVDQAARPLRSIWDLYTRTACFDPPGVRIQDLPGSARALRVPLRGYTYSAVLPALMERGLYRREDYSMMGLFPVTRYVETAAGTVARAELRSFMETAEREFGADAGPGSRQALALVGMLGPAILLMDPLLPDIARLSRVLRDGMGNTAMANGFELHASNLDADFADLDLGALDKLEGAFDAIGDMGDGGSGGWSGGGGDSDGGGDGGGDSGSDGGGGGD